MQGSTILVVEPITGDRAAGARFLFLRAGRWAHQGSAGRLSHEPSVSSDDSIAHDVSAVVGEGRPLALPRYYPVTTRGLKQSESFRKGDLDV
jgi:hypothetical protein